MPEGLAAICAVFFFSVTHAAKIAAFHLNFISGICKGIDLLYLTQRVLGNECEARKRDTRVLGKGKALVLTSTL